LAFADSVAESFKREEVDGIIYRIPTRVALEIHHRPGHDPDAVIKAREADGKKPVTQVSVANASERYRLFCRYLAGASCLDPPKAEYWCGMDRALHTTIQR